MHWPASGILLHPTSLAGPYGSGDLGTEAWRFVDRLAAAGVGVWQMLPVTVPGAFGSPYDGRSVFAGDPALVSPEGLVRDGLLDELGDPTDASENRATLLEASWRRFCDPSNPVDRAPFEAFCDAKEQRSWLDDWALFAALDGRWGPDPWQLWPEELRDRRPAALAQARGELAAEIDFHKYAQWQFDRQYRALRHRARSAGIRFCGDLPIYPALHSADVWARRELFDLDGQGRPRAAAGVPPDAFSDTGQLWGNPVYRWPRHREDGFDWWVDRLRAAARRFDFLRLDHFRGFVAYWRVPLPATDARGGSWRRGPGRGLFRAIAEKVDGLELIAEDLGHITRPVHRLRDRLGLPGMKVLQFAFGEPDSEHLPRHWDARTVGYTGTHDNDTLVGWLDSVDSTTRSRVADHVGMGAGEPTGELAVALVREALDSEARLVVLPAQDVLGLGGEARMNKPGTVGGNWRWRLADGDFDDPAVQRLRSWLEGSRRSAGERARG